MWMLPSVTALSNPHSSATLSYTSMVYAILTTLPPLALPAPVSPSDMLLMPWWPFYMLSTLDQPRIGWTILFSLDHLPYLCSVCLLWPLHPFHIHMTSTPLTLLHNPLDGHGNQAFQFPLHLPWFPLGPQSEIGSDNCQEEDQVSRKAEIMERTQ